jgi:hypothetical protein
MNENHTELNDNRSNSTIKIDHRSLCSHCLPIQTKLTPQAWTLSTLRQTSGLDSKLNLNHSLSRSDSTLDGMNTSELLKQYHLLKVSLYIYNK